MPTTSPKSWTWPSGWVRATTELRPHDHLTLCKNTSCEFSAFLGHRSPEPNVPFEIRAKCRHGANFSSQHQYSVTSQHFWCGDHHCCLCDCNRGSYPIAVLH